MDALEAEVQRVTTPPPRDLLRGRVAIVTGGSRGIGRAVVLRLAEAGADVVVNYLRHEAAAEGVARGAERFGVKSLAVRADVSNSKETDALVERTLKVFGRCDLLVANAGIWEGAPVEELSEESWDRVLDTNLKGTWTSCRAVVPAMKRQGSGSIVMISSTAGQRGEAGYANYAASQGGQISLCKSLAAELAPHVRVNCVAPGWVDTELNDPVFSDKSFKRKTADAIPLRRLASADDVAMSVLFLASDWARHITGEILNLNGGAVLCG